MVKNKKIGKFSSFLNLILFPKNQTTGFQKSLKSKLIFPVDLENVIGFCIAFLERGERICFPSGS